MNKKLFNSGYCHWKCRIYKHRVDADVPFQNFVTYKKTATISPENMTIFLKTLKSYSF